MTSRNSRTAGRALALGAALVLALAPAIAEARASKGTSSGNRGARTESAAPATSTAPGATQGFQRSTGPSQAAPSAGVNRPATRAAPAAGGMFSSPLARGIMGGLIGAGIFGLLSGSGLFSGLGGLASIMGLMLQIALLAGLAWLAVSWWRRRQQPAAAASAYGRSEPMDGGPQPYAAPYSANEAPRSALGGLGGALGGGLGGASAGTGSGFGSQTRPLKIDGPDFEAFEKLLVEVQQAYANEDVGHLRKIATAEMAGYFADDIADQHKKNLVAKSGNVKLLQGDLSEAWTENSGDYATVAMRFEMIDALVDRDTGKLVEGDLHKPQEITEVWTFVRAPGAGPQAWTLSAIQQVA
ncbi:MAG: putative exported protein of unknown function [Hyphomicrobiales bacterium]|nr:putative exported protein of unknown function [Hyphomicrobiales bacterium]